MSLEDPFSSPASRLLQRLVERAESIVYSIHFSPATELDYISPGIEKITGYKPYEFYNHRKLLFKIIHLEDRRQLAALPRSILDQPGVVMSCRLWRKDSALIWLEHVNLPVFDENGKLIKIQGIARDVTPKMQLSSRDNLIKDVALMVVEDRPLNQILSHVCKKIVEIYGLNFSWIGMKEMDGSVSIGAAEGSPDPLPRIRELIVRWDETVEGQGVAGKVIRSGQTIIVDFRRDIFQPWYDRLVARKIRSVAAFPLKTKGTTLGSLAIYSNYEKFFTPRIITEMEDFCEQVALAINNSITKQQLALVTTGLDSTVNAVVITDRNFLIQWSNKTFLTMAQCCDAAFRNKPFHDIAPIQNQTSAYYTEIRNCLLEGKTWRSEATLLQRNNKYLSVEMIVTPVKNEEQKISYYIIVLHDLTFRRQAESALYRYQFLFQNANDIILIVHPTRRIIEANPAALKAYGYPKDALLSMKINENFEPEAPQLQTGFDLLEKASTLSGTLFETEHHRLAGSGFPVEISSAIAVIEEEQVIFILIRDITDRKQAELHKQQVKETIMQSEKLASLGRMAASISHEINQPLNSIKVITDSIGFWHRKGITADTPDLMKAIENISTQADKIDKVIKHIRAFLQGKGETLLAPFDLNSIIESTSAFLESQLQSNGIQLRKNLESNLPLTLATPTGLEEIILNLVLNAIHALKKTKRKQKLIAISTTLDIDTIVMEVKDNGPGIEASIRNQIFEPFFSTKHSEGMGLGLAIVKSIVLSYRGSIMMLDHESGGAAFRVEFPVWQAHADRKDVR